MLIIICACYLPINQAKPTGHHQYIVTSFRAFLGALHMSPVTGLARLPGRILLSVHMGHFSPVDRDEIHETKANGET